MHRSTPIILAALGLAVAGCGAAEDATTSSPAGASVASSSPAAAATGAPAGERRVAGTIEKSLLVSGDKEALAKVEAGQVWCRWNDGEVELHVRFVNGMAAHVTVQVQPNYRLKGAGLHGDGAGSAEGVGIDAGATREWSKRLGSPSGVNGTPTISECAPEINSVELG